MRILLLLVMCVGCSYGTVPVYVPNGMSIDEQFILQDAADLWNLEVRWKDTAYGSITWEFRDPTPNATCGSKQGGVKGCCSDCGGIPRPCHRTVWAERSVSVAAHEMGHALGLDHHTEPGNVMTNGDMLDGLDITLSQLETVTEGALQLEACWL